MNKRLRNKALRGSTRLLTCDYNGEDWYTNTYVATKYPIFDGYRVKKSQTFLVEKPNLTKAVGDYEYNLAEFVTDDDGYKLISSTANKMKYKLDTDYYNLVMNIYPKALPYVRADGKLAPVLFKDNGEDVAFIMPLYR